MPQILCKCGEHLRYGDIPNPIEWLAISDTAFDAYDGHVDAEQLYKAMTHLLRCPNCQRLWVFWEGFGAPPTEYVMPADGAA